jgi:hypothetical protein
MALRHSLVAKGVRFDEAFGLVGDGGILGAETSLTRQLALQGVKSLFAPSVRLRHIVHRHQFTPRWVLRRTYRSGRADFAISHPQGSAGAAELFHAPRWIVRLWLEQMLALPRAALTFDRARVMARLQRIAFHLGQIAQARRMAMAARPAGERAA